MSHNKKRRKPWEKKLESQLRQARRAWNEVRQLPTPVKNKLLMEVAQSLEKAKKQILRENQKDLKQAKRDGLSFAMIDRLTLTLARIQAMADGVRVVARLKDPIGRVEAKWRRTTNNLRISRVVVPIGVILIIYESRPNVTVECASLCLKSGNTVILRGGREAFYSNRVLVSFFEKVLTRHKLSKAIVTFVKTTDRAAVDFLLQRPEDIHLVIPRGGETLIRKVAALSKIPVIKHYQGICHVYIDKKANLQKAWAIAYNAKLQRPGVCNAMETLLVHKQIAPVFLPSFGERLKAAGCEVRGDSVTRRYMPWAKAAKRDDYGREFLAKVLAVKVVPNIESAMDHIQTFGSAHTDAIVTQDRRAAETFKKEVDSSSVMVNASTRFADGFEYGFGAEIGISTDKIHVRGPMGLDGLTSYKYVVEGNGQIRT